MGIEKASRGTVQAMSKRMAIRAAWGAVYLSLACAAFAQLAVTDLDKAWKDDLQLGQQFQRQGRIQEAEELLLRALKNAEKIGKDSLPAAACLNGLAILYHSQKSYAAAEPLYLRALSLVETAVGASHPRVGVLHKNLGELYRSQGRMPEAAEQFHRAFEITEAQLPPRDPGLIEPLKALAELDFLLGRFDDAVSAQRRVLAILEQSEPRSAGTVDSLNNLGVIHVSAGRFDEAEPWFRRALEAGEAAWGAEDPRLSRSLVYLADIWRRRLQLAEAESLLGRSLAICGSDRQAEKAELAMALNNLAEVYSSQRFYPKAEELFQRSIGVWERVAGPEDPELATGLYNLAALYRQQQRYDEADALFQKALRILKGKLGPNDPRVMQVSGAYDEMLASLGRAAKTPPGAIPGATP